MRKCKWRVLMRQDGRSVVIGRGLELVFSSMRFLAEVILVLGGFTLNTSSGNGIKVVSWFCLTGTMTGRLKFHLGMKINKAMMIAWVISEIHAASRRR